MNTKKFVVKFVDDGMASTLPVSSLGLNESGWLIVGDVIEDYYEWVNKFVAKHPKYGKVKGDFEKRLLLLRRKHTNILSNIILLNLGIMEISK